MQNTELLGIIIPLMVAIAAVAIIILLVRAEAKKKRVARSRTTKNGLFGTGTFADRCVGFLEMFGALALVAGGIVKVIEGNGFSIISIISGLGLAFDGWRRITSARRSVIVQREENEAARNAKKDDEVVNFLESIEPPTES